MVVLYFYTENNMCRLVDELIQDTDIDIYCINAAKNTREVDRYNICTTPTLVFLDREGSELGRMTPSANMKKI